MTQLSHRLRHRVVIQRAIHVPSPDGGSIPEYQDMTTIWGELKPVYGGTYLANRQTDEKVTHELIVRESSISSLGSKFGDGFNEGFDSLSDLRPLQDDLFVWKGRAESSTRGQRFKIRRAVDVDERREYVVLYLEEIGEEGTGR